MQETISRIRLLLLVWLPSRDQWEELQKLCISLFAFVGQIENQNRIYRDALALISSRGTQDPDLVASLALGGFETEKSKKGA
jgi:hypothetical protein